MRTTLLNIMRLTFMCYLLSTIPSCGIDVEVSGQTEHVIKIDEDTLEAFRDLCQAPEQETEDDCVQRLIDLFNQTKNIDVEDL